jgi:D-amino-acid dehydrogenase
VDLQGGTKVLGMACDRSVVRISTDRGELVADDVVLAAGWRTPHLARMLGAPLPLLPARGHSVSLETTCRPRMPLLLSEAHLVVTPMLGHVRMTTGLELGSSDMSPDKATAAAMARDAGRFFVDESPSYRDPWVGFRPLTPDGMPIVGRLRAAPRVLVTSGYGTLGMTLAPALARIVSCVLRGEKEPDLVSPRRFGV